MKQQTLAQESFELYRKPMQREKFLNEMERVIPWQALHDLLEPHYPKAGNGRRPVGLMKRLRLHFLQHWYNLSDPGLEEALYESESTRLCCMRWRICFWCGMRAGKGHSVLYASQCAEKRRTTGCKRAHAMPGFIKGDSIVALICS